MNASQSCCPPAEVDQKQRVQYSTPRYEVIPSAEATVVQVELPGVAKSDLKISVENQELSLEATTKLEQPDTWKVLHRESSDRAYRLRLRLGKQVDSTGIQADLEDGVLALSIPKAEEAKPRTIKVK